MVRKPKREGRGLASFIGQSSPETKPVSFKSIMQRVARPDAQGAVEELGSIPDAAEDLANKIIEESSIDTELKVFVLNKILEFYSSDTLNIASMPKAENDTLSEIFDLLAKLPDGELKRSRESLKKKVAKWEGVPKRAPELYQDRQASEELPEFLRRVYGQAGLLNGQLMTVHFDILDPPLAAAIRGYVGHYGALPDDINLPAKFERADKGTPRKQKRAEVRLTSG